MLAGWDFLQEVGLPAGLSQARAGCPALPEGHSFLSWEACSLGWDAEGPADLPSLPCLLALWLKGCEVGRG